MEIYMLALSSSPKDVTLLGERMIQPLLSITFLLHQSDAGKSTMEISGYVFLECTTPADFYWEFLDFDMRNSEEFTSAGQ
jgi:hypothetical protein